MSAGRMHRAVLVLAGITLIAVGAGAAFLPDAFYGSYGIELGGDAGLMSELRSAGMALLLLGMIVGAGAFVSGLTTTATLIGAVVLLAYAGGRLLSWAVDGAPSTAMAAAAVVELVIGAACLWLLVRTTRTARAAPTARSAPVTPRPEPE